ncbi:MAG: rhomboid family intramembrane serine protease [Alphaproteobacteria bacterium]|jgi:membrane associated rhomboid family serine protease|nr:rhomboid family intramembrane serine protease [Alphaproteobacteria bacterium]
MFLPISDANPLRRIHAGWVTIGLIVACIGVFIAEWTLTERELNYWFARFAYTPSLWFGPVSGNVDMRALVREPLLILSPLTSQFLHAGLGHLVANMLFLRVFGDNIEDSLGHGRYLLFYLLCGVAAAVAQTLPDPHAQIPMVGASGAISGIIGAYAVLYPTARIRIFVFWFYYPMVPAFLLIGLWIGMQVLFAIIDDGSSHVAWWAHIGGFMFGAAAVKFFMPNHAAVPGAAVGASTPATRIRDIGRPAAVPEPVRRPRHALTQDLRVRPTKGRGLDQLDAAARARRSDAAASMVLIWILGAIALATLAAVGVLTIVLAGGIVLVVLVATVVIVASYRQKNVRADAAAARNAPDDPDAALDHAMQRFDDALSGRIGAPRRTIPVIRRRPR